MKIIKLEIELDDERESDVGMNYLPPYIRKVTWDGKVLPVQSAMFPGDPRHWDIISLEQGYSVYLTEQED